MIGGISEEVRAHVSYAELSVCSTVVSTPLSSSLPFQLFAHAASFLLLFSCMLLTSSFDVPFIVYFNLSLILHDVVEEILTIRLSCISKKFVSLSKGVLTSSIHVSSIIDLPAAMGV